MTFIHTAAAALDQPLHLSPDHGRSPDESLYSQVPPVPFHFILPKHTQVCHFPAPKPPVAPDACKTKLKHLRLAFKAFHGPLPICSLNFPLTHSLLHPRSGPVSPTTQIPPSFRVPGNSSKGTSLHEASLLEVIAPSSEFPWHFPLPQQLLLSDSCFLVCRSSSKLFGASDRPCRL